MIPPRCAALPSPVCTPGWVPTCSRAKQAKPEQGAPTSHQLSAVNDVASVAHLCLDVANPKTLSLCTLFFRKFACFHVVRRILFQAVIRKMNG
jgi:hypothetical protein